MQKVVVNIDNPADVAFFLKIVKSLNFVRSAKIEGEEYDWTNPSRPATEEECEEMIAEAEKSPSMTAKDAQEYSVSLSKTWQK